MRRVRHRRGGFGLMLLLYQIYNTGFDRIPPVTLATVGAQVAIYLRLLKKLPKHKDVCISTVHVWYRHEWKRLALGAFYHADDWHLYYNMASFLWKGMTLERKFGSPYFFYLLAVLTVVVNMTTVALGFAADRLLHDPSYLTACAVGFSGVIFALKVITTHSTPPGVVRVMGFLPVHSRWSCWLELALIQLLVPNASFVGHLAGILVGLAYVKGPLRNIMDYFVPADLMYAQAGRNARYRDRSDAGSRSYGARPSYTYRSGSTGYNTRRSANPGLRYNVAPHDRPGMSEEEQVQEAMRRSRGDYESSSHGHHRTERAVPSAPLTEEFSSPNLYPDLRNVGGHEGNPPDTGYGWREEVTNRNANLEEVRRRRLARFDR